MADQPESECIFSLPLLKRRPLVVKLSDGAIKGGRAEERRGRGRESIYLDK